MVASDEDSGDLAWAIEDPPDEPAGEVIAAGLHRFDIDAVGEIDYRPVAVVVRDSDGTVVGGLTGTIGGGWMYVFRLWVSPAMRGRGLGRELLRRAERESVRRGCPRAFLNTLSWQAPAFYERCGYTQFAALEEAPGPHSRVFFRKDLAAE